MKTETKETTETALRELGFSLAVLIGPRADVADNDWPNIKYRVELRFNDKPILETDYKLGVGHVDCQNPKVDTSLAGVKLRLSSDEESLLRIWQRKPHAQFVSKPTWATVAAKLATYQKVAPSLPDVVHSLLLDGEPYFNGESFEDWASNFGYETDSRKAEEIYKACMEIGRQLKRGLPHDTITKAREILQDY